jgi:inositol polyphosphate 5-phosphatase INPP5B/F
MATSPKESKSNDASDSFMPGAFPDPVDSNQTSQQTLSQAIYDRRSEYTKPRKIRIKIGSWNVGNHNCSRDIGAWFTDGKGVEGRLTGLSLSEDRPDHEGDKENIQAQEARQSSLNKREPTIPHNDPGEVPAGDDVGLYVLGLQEIVDVSSPAEALRPYTDPTTANKYKEALQEALPPGYKLMAEQQLIGLFLMIYAAPSVAEDVRFVSTTSVGTGLMGYMGNKGAVTARLVLGETTRLVFVNCHLAAGADKAALDRRNWDSAQINTRTRFDPVEAPIGPANSSGEGIGDEDFAFWFGDLNYRLEGIPGDDVRRLLTLHTRNEYDISLLASEKDEVNPEDGQTSDGNAKSSSSIDTESISSSNSKTASQEDVFRIPEDLDPASLQATLESLLPHDELAQQIKTQKAFHEGWNEGPIRFLPTYKYDVGTVGVFDSSDKKRGPSWCDRILYRSRKNYQAYKKRAQEADEARKKDEEMKARGIEEDENVIFDYNPDEDGDEYDDTVGSQSETVTTNTGHEDDIFLEYYVAHQRVLSSDHKPLDAIFSLTYPAIDAELKAKIHAEVARDLDRKENEGRPTVTVVIDRTSRDFDEPATDEQTEGVVHFGTVRLGKGKHRVCTVANTGQVAATLSFVDRPVNETDSAGPAPPWLLINFDRAPDPPRDKKTKLTGPPTFTIEPGDACTIEFTARVEPLHIAPDVFGDSGIVTLDDVLILRVHNGRDHFVPVQARCARSSLDRSIDKLKHLPEDGLRKLQSQKPSSPDSPRIGRSLFSRSDPF